MRQRLRACCSSLRPLSLAKFSSKDNVFVLASHFYQASIDVILPIAELYIDFERTAETAVALLTNFAGFQKAARRKLAAGGILWRLLQLFERQLARVHSGKTYSEALCERISQLLLNISVGMYGSKGYK